MLQKTLPFQFFCQVLVHDRNFNNLMPQKIRACKTKLENEQSTKKNSEVVILNGSPTY